MGGLCKIKTLIPAPQDGEDGQDAVAYDVHPAVAVVSADADGNVTTGAIEVTAYRIVGGTRSSNLLGVVAQAYGADPYPYYAAQYRIDSGSWTNCGNISVGAGLQAALGYGIPAAAVATTTKKISVRLIKVISQSTSQILGYASDLTIVKDGKTGDAGPKYYYDGEYPAGGQRYEILDGWAPVVEYHTSGNDEIYWYLNAKNNVASNGTFIAPSAQNNTWKLADKFSVFITQAIFAKYAQFGGAIFNGNWMMSANGHIGALAINGTSKMVCHNPTEDTNVLPQSLFNAAYPSGMVARLYEDINENPNGQTTTWNSNNTSVHWHNSIALTAGKHYVYTREFDLIEFPLSLVVGDSNGNILMTLAHTEAGSDICVGGVFTVNASGTYKLGIVDENGAGGSALNDRCILQEALFVPNYCVDLATGESFQKKAYSEGGTRSPFKFVTGTEFAGALWDNCSIFTGGLSGTVTNYTLPWDTSQSGRRLVITNAYWGGQYSYGDANIAAPAGKYFFYNGRVLSNIKVQERSGVELLGYGSKDVFYGWIVLEKFDMITSKRYGRNIKCLAFGAINGTSSSASLSGVATENSSINLSVTRTAVGKYTLSFANNIFSAAENVVAQLTPMGTLTSATIASRTVTSISIETRVNGTLTDGSFTFALYNSRQW